PPFRYRCPHGPKRTASHNARRRLSGNDRRSPSTKASDRAAAISRTVFEAAVGSNMWLGLALLDFHASAARAEGPHQAAELQTNVAHQPLHVRHPHDLDLAQPVVKLVEYQPHGLLVEDRRLPAGRARETMVEALAVEPLAREHIMPALRPFPTLEQEKLAAIHEGDHNWVCGIWRGFNCQRLKDSPV